MDAPSIEYLAGFFDGEGGVTIHRTDFRHKVGWSSRHALRVHVANTDILALQAFRDRFGGGCINRKPPRSPKHTEGFQWIASATVAVRTLEALLPFLRVKKRDAEIGLAFQELIGKGKKWQRVSHDALEKRETLRLQLVQRHGNATRAAV